MDEAANLLLKLDPAQAQQEIAKQLSQNNFTPEQAAEIQRQYEEYQKQQLEKVEKQRQQHLQARYQQLLKVVDELGRDIRPAYAGSKGAPERLKKGIHSARSIVRECLAETERQARSEM